MDPKAAKCCTVATPHAWHDACVQILVELAELQDQEVGDGTTSVVIVAAEFLKRANDLVRSKIHPTSIIGGFRLAMREVRGRTEESPIAEHGRGMEGFRLAMRDVRGPVYRVPHHRTWQVHWRRQAGQARGGAAFRESPLQNVAGAFTKLPAAVACVGVQDGESSFHEGLPAQPIWLDGCCTSLEA